MLTVQLKMAMEWADGPREIDKVIVLLYRRIQSQVSQEKVSDSETVCVRAVVPQWCVRMWVGVDACVLLVH